MTEDLFKNPYKTYLFENDNPYNLPQLSDGTYVAPEVFKQGAIRKHYPGQKVLFHTIIHNRLQQQRRAEARQMHESNLKSWNISLEENLITPLSQLPNGLYVAPHMSLRKGNLLKRMINDNGDHVVFVHPHIYRQIAQDHSLAEARIRDWNGRLVDTDIGGYYHPETGNWVPHKPASGGWTRHDSGMRPSRSPVNKSKWTKAADHYGPINKAAHEARMEEARKKAEAKELKRLADEQLLVRRQQLINKRQSEIDNPTEPKPRGRPPKNKNTKWW
jgi:hypothetical protein